MKLTFFERLAVFFGFRYVYNPNTKEVHRLLHKHKNCNLQAMKDKYYMTERRKNIALANGADGCRWCYREKNTG